MIDEVKDWMVKGDTDMSRQDHHSQDENGVFVKALSAYQQNSYETTIAICFPPSFSVLWLVQLPGR